MVDSFAIGELVHDRWWPERLGRVFKVTKTSVYIRWFDSATNRYDLAHLQFIVKEV